MVQRQANGLPECSVMQNKERVTSARPCALISYMKGNHRCTHSLILAYSHRWELRRDPQNEPCVPEYRMGEGEPNLFERDTDRGMTIESI